MILRAKGDRYLSPDPVPSEAESVTGLRGETAGVTGGDRFSEDDVQAFRVTGDRFSPIDRPIRARVRTDEQKLVSHPSPVTAVNCFISTPVRLTNCPRCGHPVLEAWVDGLHTHADPDHLAPAAELATVLAGRRTYNVTVTGAHCELFRRDQWRIRGHHDQPVVAEHRDCRPVDHVDRTPPVLLVPASLAARAASSTPPF